MSKPGLIGTAISQPITVAVGTLLAVFAGILAVTIVPIRMTPEVSSVVVSVTTNWESASAEEVESDIVEEQEKVLGEVTGLLSLTSTSANGQGSIRLEFETGTDIEKANADVLQKLDEVPGYPNGVLQPKVEPVDIESVDYIAWIGLSSSDPNFPAETLHDLMERRIRPRFERIKGISQVGVRGSVQSELHIIVDPVAMAQRGITYAFLRQSITNANANFSAGKLADGKRDIRVRATGRFQSPDDIESMVIRKGENGSIFLRDIATVKSSYKEPTSWVRARGIQMPFFNFQLQRGANLLETMELLREEVRKLNAPDGLLAQEARDLGLIGTRPDLRFHHIRRRRHLARSQQPHRGWHSSHPYPALLPPLASHRRHHRPRHSSLGDCRLGRSRRAGALDQYYFPRRARLRRWHGRRQCHCRHRKYISSSRIWKETRQGRSRWHQGSGRSSARLHPHHAHCFRTHPNDPGNSRTTFPGHCPRHHGLGGTLDDCFAHT
ncbi:efflux RND transporter permease subunit, partial [Akkermansiaceae bacterium]|nr:efflux RND transporter permease subunit [Akkermansiaceae bacterium]